ncbi:MAG TPA: hypothetical protein IAA48_00875 [Candidatus Eubacterium faecipullorum]|uniref:Uncharacterized protein n=1 Tax=Candidatus Eubacterium faecipullorum TaxID=2838571 RepID=A0A9D1RB15_9FIRM|nr:hypothetical protein [Candidatus Eubacterium faecipullorum]
MENLNDINDIIAGLSPSDIDMLKGVAQSILGGEGASQDKSENSAPPSAPAPVQNNSNPLGLGVQDFQMMMRAKQIFDKMNATSNKNTDLILALKPHLSPENRNKADTALKILRLFDILPMLKDLF